MGTRNRDKEKSVKKTNELSINPKKELSHSILHKSTTNVIDRQCMCLFEQNYV